MNRAALRTGSASAARAPLVFAIVLAFAGAGAAARAQEPDAGVVPLEEGETEPEQTPEREPVEESAVEAEAETQTESTEEEPGAEDGEEDSEEPSSEEDDFANMSLEALLTYRVVSASLLEEDAWSAPAIISVVTQDDMREWGWLSVAELLQFQPGFYAINDFVNYNVGIRGVNGGMGAQSQVLRTMLDGRDLRFRPTGGSFFGPELVPRLAIRQVEIVRGPVSSLYGADAFLGAINIIPNRAADMGAGNARATVTTINQWNHWGMQGDAAVWADPGGVDSIITASVRSTDRGGLRLPESSPQYDSLTAGLGRNYIERDTELAVSALSRFELDWEEGSAVLDANVQFFERDANFNFESSPLSDGRTSMYTFGSTLRLNHTFERKVRLRTFAAYSRGGITDRERLVDRFIEAGIPYLRRTLNYQSLETRLELTYADELPFGPIPFSITLGGDYVFDNVDLPSVTGYRPEPLTPLVLGDPSVNANFHNGAGFAQIRVRPFEWLTVLGGVRVEGHTLYGEQVSYRASVAYSDRLLTVKLLYGRSFKAPSIYLLYAQPAISGGPEANPDLAAQFAQTGELNVGVRPAPWIVLSLTGYISEIDGFARIDTESFIPRAENSADLLSYGFEFEATIDHVESGLEAFANVAYARAEETSEAGGAEITERARLYPEITFSLGLQFHWREAHLRFIALDRFASTRRADASNVVRNGGDDYDLPMYNILSLGIYTEGLEIFSGRDTEFGVRFDNLLFQNYAEPGFLGVDVPGEQWSLRLTASQQF